MNITTWGVAYFFFLLFWLWVIFLNGANMLAQSKILEIIINIFAPQWDEENIKFYAWFLLIIGTILFLMGIFIPEMRNLYWYTFGWLK